MNYTDIEKSKIFKKYDINPKEFFVIGAEINQEEKENLIRLLLYAFELSRKNLIKGNMTSSSYACGLVLEDGGVYFGVNFNNTRNEISAICAERLAMLEAFNSRVQGFNPEENKKFDFKIKYILMSSYRGENVFWQDKITPCADCLSWFNTGKNLSLETKICSIKKNFDGKFYLNMQNLSDFLPLRDTSYKTIENLSESIKILRSENARQSNVSDNDIIKLYTGTYQTYKNNNLAKTSGQNIAAGVISNGEFFFGAKVDFSKRWFTEPLDIASQKAIEKFGLNTKIDAICYVGEEYTITETGETVKDGLISIRTLGRICTRFANENTLVITGSQDGIQADTISDYMPGEHKFIHKYEIK